MFARIATFEIPADAPPEVEQRVVSEVRKRVTSDAGPQGMQRMLMLIDRQRNRALGVSMFDSEESMKAADSFFEEMQPVTADQGGRRVEVGHFEVLLDEAPGGGS
jgi:hypothetical protein